MQRTICGLSRLCRSTNQRQSSIPSITLLNGQWIERPKYRQKTSSFYLFTRHRNLYTTAHRVIVDDDEFLTRCRPYGITSLLELDRESSLDTRSNEGKVLIDEYPHRQDLNLWSILLDYQIRQYGSKGATSIWRGLKYRGPRVSLESEDDLTTEVWQKLLQCAAEHNDLHLTKRLCERNGLAWNRPKLFAETISALLRAGRDFQVGVMCDRLREKHQNGIADVLDLYDVFQPQHHQDLKAFCTVYEKLHSGKMYGKGVAHLFGNSRPEDAFLLHKFLISRGDFPSSFSEIEPFMKYLARSFEDPGPFLRNLAACGVVFSGQGRLVHEHESQRIALISPGTAVTEDIGPEMPWSNKVSDTFAAKAFAAKALSFEFILNTLRAFGLTEVGPQSIREIGLAAGSLEDFSARLAKLDGLGIDTGGSAFSRFVRKICAAGNATLLQQALQTDMHHDVFEDIHLQQRLLIESLNKCAWPQVNLLLAMLNRGQVLELNGFVKSDLLSSIANDDLKSRSFLTLSANLMENKIRLPQRLIHDLTEHLNLRVVNARKSGKLVQGELRSRARFAAGVLQAYLACGQQVTESQWRLLFTQLGRSGALQEVHKLTLWLAVWHSEHTSQAIDEGRSAITYSRLNWIFDHKFQGAVAHQALREQFYGRSSRVRHPWQGTLTLLRYLECSCGVHIHLPTIRKVIVLFVRGLYRRSISDVRSRNVDARKNDSKRLCFKLLKTLDEAWSRPSPSSHLERKLTIGYLMQERRQKAYDAIVTGRPTLRNALRRFPVPSRDPLYGNL